ncbi:zeta toxin family protein [Streptomyces sp. NBC_01236]|uniref:zeta toxin family protein n=1 Tax=Streptomyces sp. NBC_01236 TaxID=2903789 RepID=UPI002E11B873|nr:zeta toxin family protein [Streptomyces sp. NBC_01236]
MTPDHGPETGLAPEYRTLYRELQGRISFGGDLGPSDRDTFGQFREGVLWTPERERMHAAILDDFKSRCEGLPRDGHAALFTAGAPGAGKGGALRGLAEWQGQESELGRALAEVHGVDVRDYVVLDPDELKVAIFEHGGAPQLDPQARELPDGRQVSPSEMASLTHRESAYLLGVVEQWARSEGHNLLYDTALRDGDRTGKLLEDLRQDGYDKRVLLSVEVPVEQCLAQNANRWQQGRAEFDAGRDWYGGRMAPEGLIKDIYAQSGSGRGFSIGRENAEKLVESRLATGLITSERGNFGVPTATGAPTTGQGALTTGQGAAVRTGGPVEASPAFQQNDATIRTAAASRIRSGSGTAAVPGAATNNAAPATAPRVPRPAQAPGGGGGPAR